MSQNLYVNTMPHKALTTNGLRLKKREQMRSIRVVNKGPSIKNIRKSFGKTSISNQKPKETTNVTE